MYSDDRPAAVTDRNERKLEGHLLAGQFCCAGRADCGCDPAYAYI